MLHIRRIHTGRHDRRQKQKRHIHMKQPIDQIRWIPVERLQTNDYNPNHVFKQEMELLHTSITRNGWLQPIIINHDKTIIDGYHRVTLMKTSKELYQKTKGKVPCITLHLTKPQRILLTIRINRAKGICCYN